MAGTANKFRGLVRPTKEKNEPPHGTQKEQPKFATIKKRGVREQERGLPKWRLAKGG